MNWLINLLRDKSYRKHDGVLIGWTVYKPHEPAPNLHTHLHPDLKDDSWIHAHLDELGAYLRKYYSDWEG